MNNKIKKKKKKISGNEFNLCTPKMSEVSRKIGKDNAKIVFI